MGMWYIVFKHCPPPMAQWRGWFSPNWCFFFGGGGNLVPRKPIIRGNDLGLIKLKALILQAIKDLRAI